MDAPVAERGEWATTLADVLGALHSEAREDHPVNPFRGVPLATRGDAVADRLAALRDSGALDAKDATALGDVWHAGLAVGAWSRPPLWIHGDLHPGNLVTRDGRLAGIIDFGDVTAGDPAYDLAVAWLAFDTGGRERFIAASGSRYDTATWRRAHAWAAAVAMMLLVHNDDNPEYVALGRAAAAEVIADLSG
jgi:aminoglycoside phosphotransferase (APT) family kinase protein